MRQRGKVAELALGYHGGPGALITMGALKQGLTEEELPDIVHRWRQANPRIVQLWYEFNDAAFEAIQHSKKVTTHGITFARECDPINDLDFLTMKLPSGRKLYYAHPEITTNRFGGPSIGYYGMNQTTKKWELTETYGGKLVENAVQAIARDCLAVAIDRLEAAGYNVVFHVHDEVVIEQPYLRNVRVVSCIPETDYDPDNCPEGCEHWETCRRIYRGGDEELFKVNRILSEPMPWAPDLLLSADGWVGEFYRKD
jgi:DNA polymerase